MKEAAAAQWGYFRYVSDPDGYLWKVASSYPQVEVVIGTLVTTR